MKSHALYFTAPKKIALREEPLPPTGRGQVRVETLLSAISPGTELMVYRGLFPAGMAVDASLKSLAGEFGYPLKYGYSLAGVVGEVGPGVDPAWQDRLVFAFHPHESSFLASPEDLVLIPEGISVEDALFLPNMETAVNFVMDGAPLIGERVVVFGQGIVGLLTTALLARFPLCALITLDRYPLRRQASLDLGASACLDPDTLDSAEAFKDYGSLEEDGADLVFELSGQPAALDQAIHLAGYSGRVVIGSWYGQKRVDLDLGGSFHRSRIRLISSQVSSLAPELTGRWSKERRFELAWDMIRLLSPSRFITQRFPLQHAAQAYQMLDEGPEETIQVIFTYE